MDAKASTAAQSRIAGTSRKERTVGRELAARAQRLMWAIVLTVFAALGLVLLILTIVSVVLIAVWVGLPLTIVCITLLHRLANLYRYFVGKVLGTPVPSAYLRMTDRGLLRAPLQLARDPSNWRDLGWLAVNSTAGLVLPIAAIVESVLGLLFWWMPRSLLITIDAYLARVMLSPSDRAQLAHRVQQLTESRAETVDTQAAELRRIERDLHDGAQARLVSLGMSLGLAEEQLESDPNLARQLLAEARASNSQALSELRDLVRGIHPPVLADRGLTGAVQALALASVIPVSVETVLSERLPAPVESAAYFAVAEALTNAIKHSGARQIAIQIGYAGDLLTMQVRDDGHGGAVSASGGGLRGIERRLSAFDGGITISSPPGGPTAVSMELPVLRPARSARPTPGP
jgi:signal transduction histidine kinase